MLKLDNDCISKVYNSYINNFVYCKKNYNQLNKFYFCKKVYDICKNISINNDCHIINISNINLKLCSIHDDVDIQYVKNLLDNIESYKKRQDNELVNMNSINISVSYKILNANNYIHLFGLKKNENITKQILERYNLKIKRYCCGGSGCMLEDIN